jgi:hypothetical protein
VNRLADRDRVHSGATVQADIRQLLLPGGLGLGEDDLDVDLETPVTGLRRIDVEVGFTVIEVMQQAELVGALDMDEGSNYITLRQHVRQSLAARAGRRRSRRNRPGIAFIGAVRSACSPYQPLPIESSSPSVTFF